MDHIKTKNGGLLTERRIKEGYTLTELGAKVGIAGTSMSRISRGVQNPRPQLAMNICAVLDLDFDEVFEIVPGYIPQ